MFFPLTIWISDVLSKFRSRHGFMADRFVCVSAFLPHTFRGNETVQMFWKEECQPGKQDHKPAVVAERPDNDPKFVG